MGGCSPDEERHGRAIEKRATIYIARDGQRAIVIAEHVNQDGVLCEGSEPIALEGSPSAEQIGSAVAREMGKTARIFEDLRNWRRSDWPAYKTSGEKSIRAFEARFIRITVEGANSANLIAVITGSPDKDAELKVTSSISTAVRTSEMGEAILRVFCACRDRTL